MNNDADVISMTIFLDIFELLINKTPKTPMWSQM
ncbi:UNVERIFIED_ORG: hypothetical protein DFS12_101596 [Chitinophaga ginsengisegetis]|nr:hypothetical protein [Chitinophaga ginsengisegetis]MDR6645356.1 hypothetical protein [Chitinophaga ginsengisegetis]MDR6652053.1 hypothetical protein [Chitinophaga ginsengisegetis]